jgi:HSP20 family protein
MLPVRFDPFSDIKEYEKRFFPSVSSFFKDDKMSGFKPAVNTREGEYAYHVEVDLPGVKKEDVKVDITGHMLTISGERKTKEEVNEKEYYKCESSYGKFQRSFSLPENIDKENLSAIYENGVLEVVIPKSKTEEVKKIEVK